MHPTDYLVHFSNVLVFTTINLHQIALKLGQVMPARSGDATA